MTYGDSELSQPCKYVKHVKQMTSHMQTENRDVTGTYLAVLKLGDMTSYSLGVFDW